jgi:serine/tyrosine/threonine adenylyltransferase
MSKMVREMAGMGIKVNDVDERGMMVRMIGMCYERFNGWDGILLPHLTHSYEGSWASERLLSVPLRRFMSNDTQLERQHEHRLQTCTLSVPHHTGSGRPCLGSDLIEMTSASIRRRYFSTQTHATAMDQWKLKLQHITNTSATANVASFAALILVLCMLLRQFSRVSRTKIAPPSAAIIKSSAAVPRARLAQMSSQTTNGHTNGQHQNGANGQSSTSGVTISAIPKSNNFTMHLPPDPAFPTPKDSHSAPRQKLGPRMVRGALYTFVRPEPSESPELLAISSSALRDIGLAESEATSAELAQVVAGNKFYWEEASPEEGIYPWAQCYGGFQFGQWAGQLGDGRAISLFETTNPTTGKRYELQLKGAGKTPYSRFADGKAVLRSSIREFIVSEYLNAIGIPTTRALSLTLCEGSEVVRERLEPGAIVARFAESWVRFGTFDLMRSRGDRDNIRKLASYVAEEVFGGWENMPGVLEGDEKERHINPKRGVNKDELQGEEGAEENRFARLYREIARRSALLVGKMQAYGFMNGVLNTDNTSIYGLSMDYGPFAFMDNFDPAYTPNHDDHMLRYSYRAQPSVFWWNLVRLGETLGELIGAGDKVDDEIFVEKGVEEDFAPVLIKRAETIIDQVNEEYKAVFMSEYRRLMTARLGLKTQKESDFEKLFSELLDTMEALELDFNHFFRRLSSVTTADVVTKEAREKTAERFFHHGGVTGLNETNDTARLKIGAWLDQWRARIVEDWQITDSNAEQTDSEREKAMKRVNPNFVPRGWLLDEIIERVEKKHEREILKGAMEMTLAPFQDSWNWDEETEQRFCGDVPRLRRAIQCSCSS